MKKSILTIFAAMVAGICLPLFAQDATAETASSSKSEFALQAEDVSPIVFKTNDGVFACEQDAATGNITVKLSGPTRRSSTRPASRSARPTAPAVPWQS